MGNLCGKQSKDDHFNTPGRTLASAPPADTKPTSAVPVKVGGPARTLGGSSSRTQEQEADARRKAAEAAEVGA
jgi:hypothetical protein